MAKYRVYSDDDRARALLALDACGGNVKRAAEQTGYPRTTVAEWRDGNVHPTVTEFRHAVRERLADRLEDLAHQCLDAIPAKLPDASLRALAALLAICIDRMRLLREQATVIERQAPLSEEERLRQLSALFENARVRSNGKAPPGGH